MELRFSWSQETSSDDIRSCYLGLPVGDPYNIPAPTDPQMNPVIDVSDVAGGVSSGIPHVTGTEDRLLLTEDEESKISRVLRVRTAEDRYERHTNKTRKKD